MKSEEGKVSVVVWVVAVLSFLVVAGGAVYVLNNNKQSQGPSVADVSRNAEDYYGQQLSLKGEMEDIKSGHVFTLDQEGTATGDEILVLSIPSVEPQGGSSDDLSSLNGQDVQVSGTVRKLSGIDVQKETGLDLDPQLVIEFNNRPVLIAREVDYLSER